MTDLSQPLIASGVRFYHENDERAFFEWLARIACLERFEGELRDLFIHLAGAPSDDDLRELAAFLYRYKIDMRQLARFSTGTQKAWFREPKMYWHKRVFGGAVR
jgi:hypothetical protein